MDRGVLLWTVLVCALAALAKGNQSIGAQYGLIDMCEVQYVHPGSDFQVTCRTDNGIATKIYTPTENIPSGAALRATAETMKKNQVATGLVHNRRAITIINEYPNATKATDEGIYTCFVFHGAPYEPPYSRAECQVMIQDLCENHECGLEKVCEADYSTGEYECTCNLGCKYNYDPHCTNRCEVVFNPCAMREQTCNDGLFRKVANKGFCPTRQAALIRDFEEEMEAVDGEKLMLTSGVLQDGIPPVRVEWEFHPRDGREVQIFSPQSDPFEVTVEGPGVYKAVVRQCEEVIKTNEYSVFVESPELLTQLKYTCSVFPAGAVESFDGTASYLNLACTHALAADFRPAGGDEPWFIYGTFDEHDGDTALQAMTFYLGRNIFEIQRGWIIHLNGEKMELEEGVVKDIPNTECTVRFQYWHLFIKCSLFEAMYDGLMSGHITLSPGVDSPYPPPTKRRTNIGLCWDNKSGFRPNWQIGRTDGECQIDTAEPACSDARPSQCMLEEDPIATLIGPDTAWTACGSGASASCEELRCSQSTPSPAQQCALEQAKRVSCALKWGDTKALEAAGQDPTCPEDECDWKLDLLERGCPQENPPFNCAANEIDFN